MDQLRGPTNFLKGMDNTDGPQGQFIGIVKFSGPKGWKKRYFCKPNAAVLLPKWVKIKFEEAKKAGTFDDIADCGLEELYNWGNTQKDFVQALVDPKFDGRATYMHVALKHCASKIGNVGVGGANSVCLIFTDGKPTFSEATCEEAKRIQEGGIIIITLAIGVSPAVLQCDGHSVASAPETEHSLTARNPKDTSNVNVVNKLTNVICSGKIF